MTKKKIQVFINGKKNSCWERTSLTSLLKDLNIDNDGIAIEINCMVIPKSQYENTFVKNNDNIEIVHFIGGG